MLYFLEIDYKEQIENKQVLAQNEETFFLNNLILKLISNDILHPTFTEVVVLHGLPSFFLFKTASSLFSLSKLIRK